MPVPSGYLTFYTFPMLAYLYLVILEVLPIHMSVPNGYYLSYYSISILDSVQWLRSYMILHPMLTLFLVDNIWPLISTHAHQSPVEDIRHFFFILMLACTQGIISDIWINSQVTCPQWLISDMILHPHAWMSQWIIPDMLLYPHGGHVPSPVDNIWHVIPPNLACPSG